MFRSYSWKYLNLVVWIKLNIPKCPEPAQLSIRLSRLRIQVIWLNKDMPFKNVSNITTVLQYYWLCSSGNYNTSRNRYIPICIHLLKFMKLNNLDLCSLFYANNTINFNKEVRVNSRIRELINTIYYLKHVIISWFLEDNPVQREIDWGNLNYTEGKDI